MSDDPTDTPVSGVWMTLAYPQEQSRVHQSEIDALRHVNACPADDKTKALLVFWGETLWDAEQRFNESLASSA